MNIQLVQGTWGDDDQWWMPGQIGNFYDVLKQAGHTMLNGRPFNWHGGLGGIAPFTDRDLLVWRGGGAHLYDRLDPPLRPGSKPKDLCIIGHSHARQVIKEALQAGLTADLVILVSGPIRKDVDSETPLARGRIGKLVCLHGGRRDFMQLLGGVFDSRVGWRREDPDADVNRGFPDADHSSLLTDPRQFHRVLQHLPKT